MPKTIKYIGTQDGWPEIAITGRPSNWKRGAIDERSDLQAAQLLATGLFTDVDATLLPEQKVVAISGVVSGAWNASTSGTWRPAALGSLPRFSASGGASGGTWTLSMRNAAGVVTTESAEAVAANATDVTPIFLDDATEIMVTVTGTVTVEVK